MKSRMTALALVFFLTACGVKSAPYPAADTLPQKVRQLTQTVTEEGQLILTWLPPEINMAGRPLTSLGGFQVEMAESPANEAYCTGCPPRYLSEPVDRLPARPPLPGRNLDPGPYEWRRQLSPGHVYHFRVAAVHKNGGVHPQARTETAVRTLDPLETMRLKASLGDGAVELTWARPAQGLKAEIEKRSADGPWAPLPAIDQAANHYLDLEVAYGQVYEYRGRLLSVEGEALVRGPWSREAQIRVRKLNPPPPPAYLDAAPGMGGIRLSWESLLEVQGLAGYRVYRQRSEDRAPLLITPAPVQSNVFFDPITPKGGELIRYQVTAVDTSANESRPSPMADVYLDLPAEEPARPE